jgi:hypothetical protein
MSKKRKKPLKVTTFDSPQELLAELRRRRTDADEHVLPFQAAVKPGDHYIRLLFDDHLVIYGEITDPLADCYPDEVDRVRELYAQPHMVNMRHGRHYSEACPDGELGDIHVATIAAVISDQLFRCAKAKGWPCDEIGWAWNQAHGDPDQFRRLVEQVLLEPTPGN